jgi:hypothetical protein
MFSLVSCGGTKEVVRSSSRTKSTTKTRANRSNRDAVKVDTVKWQNVERLDRSKRNEKEEVVDKKDMAPDLKDQYNVTIFLPLDTKEAIGSDLTDKSSRATRYLNYYAGVKLGLDKLEQDGININVNIEEADKGNISSKLRERSARNADVIIGPQKTSDLVTTAAYGEKNEITVVSPWKTTSDIKDNDSYLQLLPSLFDHYYKMTENASRNFEADQVYLVGRKGNSKDVNRFKYFQKYNREINGANAEPLLEFLVEEDSLLNGETAYDEIFHLDKTTVFIFPNYRSSDEKFLYNGLRRLNVEKGMTSVVAYTMPLAMDSDIITFEQYRNLNMRVVRSHYVDPTDIRVKDFKRQYFYTYNALPTEEAFEGYDMIRFIGKSLQKYGKDFQFYVSTDDDGYLQTAYDIEKVPSKKRPARGSEIEPINYFKNVHLEILEFKNNKFYRTK